MTWLRLINIYILSIILTTRKLKLMKPICMDLIFSASQIKEMVILVHFSAIFLASPLSIFACLSNVAQSFPGTQSIWCSIASARQNITLLDHSLNGAFQGQWKQIMLMNITWLRISTGRRQTSWLFTNVVPYRYHNDFCMLILPFTVHHLVWL